MRCSNTSCTKSATRTLSHQGHTYTLCGACHERVLNTLAGIRRLTQHATRILQMPRG